MNAWEEADRAWKRERRSAAITAGVCIVVANLIIVAAVVFAVVVGG